MKPFTPLELIAAHDWRRATLTTYALSASYTEAVLIEAMMRQGVGDITILTDPLGYRMALRERGAVRIGREYIVHPVAVDLGCFHPKMLVLEGDDVTHALVGSGNLTLGGWSENLECIEHFHGDGMAGAIGDVGRFFALLAEARVCQHEARNHCRALARRLEAAAARGRDLGAVRVVTSLDGPLVEPIAAAAADLGGARKLTIVSPYWERASVETLVSRLGLAACDAHVPTGRVPAPPGMDWPRGSKSVRPVELLALADDTRGLHAKLFEIVCEEGRLIVSGSANATGAALLKRVGGSGNVEVCTIRIDRRIDCRWKSRPAKAPPIPSEHLEPEDREVHAGILIAAHSPAGIEGRILTAWQSREANVTLELNRTPLALGEVKVDAERRFVVPLDLIGEELSLEGRIQLRLEKDGAVAEGFVAAPDFKGVRHRAGKALGAMLSVLKDMHAPSDVLTIMEFFRVHPETLKTPVVFSARGKGGGAPASDPIIDPRLVGRASSATLEIDAEPSAVRAELAWQRFVARLLRMCHRAGLALDEDGADEGDETDGGDRGARKRREAAAQARDRLDFKFPQLFAKWTAKLSSDDELLNILSLTHFVCITTRTPLAIAYVQRLVTLAETLVLGDAARATLAWCLIYLAAVGATIDVADMRTRMLTLGIDPDAPPDPEFALPGLAELIAGPNADLAAVVATIAATRTIHDDIRMLETGLAVGRIPDSLTTLQAHPLWPDLVEECRRPPERRRLRFVDEPAKVTACSCNIQLRYDQRTDLLRKGLCRTCHGFMLSRRPA